MLRWASSLRSVMPAYYLEARADLAGGEGLGEKIHHLNADDVAVCQFNGRSGATITDAGDLSVNGASTLQGQSQLVLHVHWIRCHYNRCWNSSVNGTTDIDGALTWVATQTRITLLCMM